MKGGIGKSNSNTLVEVFWVQGEEVVFIFGATVTEKNINLFAAEQLLQD